jgi:hypothetical protein
VFAAVAKTGQKKEFARGGNAIAAAKPCAGRQVKISDQLGETPACRSIGDAFELMLVRHESGADIRNRIHFKKDP